MTLLNDARLAAGMSPMGFLAPFLYHVAEAEPSAFNDVVMGDNACPAGEVAAFCCPESFSAAVGWDPVTGLGSPNYPILLQHALHHGRKGVVAASSLARMYNVDDQLEAKQPSSSWSTKATLSSARIGHYWTVDGAV